MEKISRAAACQKYLLVVSLLWRNIEGTEHSAAVMCAAAAAAAARLHSLSASFIVTKNY